MRACLIATVYRFEEYLPKSLQNWVHDKIRDLRIVLIENGILADNAKSGSESAAVTSARAAYQAANGEVDSKKAEIDNLEQDLERDYGPDGIFRALKGTCVSQDSGEYTYELCWMDRASQKSKKGGGNTGMGNFVRFETVEVDEDVGADGKGLGRGPRIALKFENGQHCWNGPNRATTVIIACADKDEIWKVVEMEKCIYRMDVGTPAACEAAPGARGGAKDEL
jgi:protein kinase C substrate 80K-H